MTKEKLSELLVEFAERGGCREMTEEMLDFALFALDRHREQVEGEIASLRLDRDEWRRRAELENVKVQGLIAQVTTLVQDLSSARRTLARWREALEGAAKNQCANYGVLQGTCNEDFLPHPETLPCSCPGPFASSMTTTGWCSSCIARGALEEPP